MTGNIHFLPQYLFYREARRNAPRTGYVHSGTKQYFLIGSLRCFASSMILFWLILLFYHLLLFISSKSLVARRSFTSVLCVWACGCQLHSSVIRIVRYLQSNAILVSVGWVGRFGCIIIDTIAHDHGLSITE